MFSGIAPRRGGDLGGEQPQDEAVLVRSPRGAAVAQERSAGAFLAAKAQRPIQEAIDEPFEAHGHLDQRALQARRHSIDHRAGDDRLAHAHILAPGRAVLEQVPDGHGQVVVGVHQARAARDDAVAIGVRIAAKGDVEAVFQAHQVDHGIG